MQEADYRLLVERLDQCDDLAKRARDQGVREKAAELAAGYRNLIASVDRLTLSKWVSAAPGSLVVPSMNTAPDRTISRR